MNTTPKRFAVGLSFPSKYLGKVRAIADILSETFTQRRILFQGYHEAEFARPNLDIYLQHLLIEETELVIAFISQEYADHPWSRVEWNAIRARMNQGDDESIMLLKLGEGAPNSFLNTVYGYVDISSRSPEDAAQLILDRYRLNRGEPVVRSISAQPASNQMLISRMAQDLRDGDPWGFMRKLEAQFADTSYQIQGNAEKDFQYAMHLILTLMGEDVRVEYPTSNGRIDILIRTKDYIYIFELKINQTAAIAIEQINHKVYTRPFADDPRKIFKIGVNFSTQDRCINDWMVEE